ncbi:BREX-1 system adenine-specific DNA-methyltransferase PglX [Thalassolituus oleivorans]|uniref:BREX-1 system adenine-specific DNA-methyltransferase PglX n=1 Tax=Thalassolituus oleivorans TaxID=187493 RepID=UPI0023F324BA|nr:BREX-1 system adenine-specific DNA-methyltransferase PglX [Thalassolituus oleivorans]
MNTKSIKSYAPKARKDFIAAITKQAAKYGITAKEVTPVVIKGDMALIGDGIFPASIAKARHALEERIQQTSFPQLIEQVAYNWFNRLCAIRYMELHDYLGHGRRVLSHPTEATGFQILEDCLDINLETDLPGINKQKITALKLDGTKDEQLYRELLLAQCHALHKTMPFLFEAIDDETELLLPENLTKTDSLIHDLVTEIAEDDWSNIEIIGWLYQFYISEKKDQVIGKVVKSEDIPAATQLFTPNWIVKYMVQNSLGAQWLATYPESPLKAQMEYYITPAEQTDEVNAQLKAITPESLNPEELTLIDPASGSGHILVEAYDLFKAIYLERGYRQRDIAQLILEKNLFGLDIDQRAAQLTGFALMMKGREDDRRLFERGVKLNVMAMVDSTSLDVDTLVHGISLSQHGLNAEDLTALKDLFEHATTFGSLIQVPQTLAEKLPALKQLSEINSQDMFVKEMLEHLAPLVKQAEILAVQYDAVVANPPYIGSKYHVPVLKKYLKDNYSGYEKDVFSAFIHRDLAFSKPHGRLGFMSPFVWMFISSYEDLRTRLIEKESISTLVQLEYSGFDGATVPICAFTLKKGYVEAQKGCYVRLSDFKGAANQAPKALEALKKRDCGWFFESVQDEFKNIPGSPIAYWLDKSLSNTYKGNNTFANIAPFKSGMSTTNNERFLRFWYEVDFSKLKFNAKSLDDAKESGKKWFPYKKGGGYRRWAGNDEYVVNWGNDGEEIKYAVVNNSSDPNTKHWSRRIFGVPYFFKASLTYSRISSSDLSVRYSSGGTIFSDASNGCFPEDNHLIYLAFLNSTIAKELLKVLCPTLNFMAGDVQKLPNPLSSNWNDGHNKLVESCIDISQADWDSQETSWNFKLDYYSSSKIEGYINSFIEFWVERNKTLFSCEKSLDDYFFNNFNVQGESYESKRYADYLINRDRIAIQQLEINKIISNCIGCMMGRYSLDEPGLIYANSGNEGFDDLVERGAYTKFPADDDGIIPLTDKEWFTDDAANRLVEFISVAWPAESLEENLDFLAANLSPKKGEGPRDTLRRYLSDSFFKDHTQTYKKRPIYWLFSSGKQKAFQCLVYLHRYNEGTLARMRTEYVIPLTAKMSAYEQKLKTDAEASSSAAEVKRLEKEIAQLHKQQAELSEFDEKLRHYADQRITLDLDDGVKVNYGKFGDLLANVKEITGNKAGES